MSAFCLPVTFGKSGIKMKFGLSGSVAFPEIARWIVSVMGGEGNKAQVGFQKVFFKWAKPWPLFVIFVLFT